MGKACPHTARHREKEAKVGNRASYRRVDMKWVLVIPAHDDDHAARTVGVFNNIAEAKEWAESKSVTDAALVWVTPPDQYHPEEEESE